MIKIQNTYFISLPTCVIYLPVMPKLLNPVVVFENIVNIKTQPDKYIKLIR